MSLQRVRFATRLPAALIMLAGCIGMRTPLDDSSWAGRCESATTGTTAAETRRVEPDVLIVLDRSASMGWSLTADSFCSANDSSCSARLAAVVAAVDTVVSDNPSINWGLELFATPNASDYCTVSSTPQVTIGGNTHAAIKAQLEACTTSLSTPTRLAIEAASSYLGTIDDGNNKAILLATDGLPTCAAGRSWSADDMQGAIAAAAAAKKAGFPVFVVGIGPGVSMSNMDLLAAAGGTGTYYPVTSVAGLDGALAAIARVVSSSCTFKTVSPPPDQGSVYVYVDRKLVPRDESSGWTFDASDETYSTVVLTGGYCESMLAGRSFTVDVVFGCPDVAPASVLP